MAIERGDRLLMTQHGIVQIVEAASEPSESVVVIKNNGTYSPCPVADLTEPFVLVDRDGIGLNSGNGICVMVDGQTTDDIREAHLFKTAEAAVSFRDKYRGINYFVPMPHKECRADFHWIDYAYYPNVPRYFLRWGVNFNKVEVLGCEQITDTQDIAVFAFEPRHLRASEICCDYKVIQRARRVRPEVDLWSIGSREMLRRKAEKYLATTSPDDDAPHGHAEVQFYRAVSENVLKLLST